MKRIASLLFVAASAASVYAASDVAYWNFNNSTAGTGGAPGVFNTAGAVEYYNAGDESLNVATSGANASSAKIYFADLVGSMGGASANNNWGTFGGSLVNANLGDVVGGSLAVIGSGQTGHFVKFKFSTAGFNNLTLSYATQRTGTGASSQAWSISTDDLTYSPITTVSTIPSSFGLQSFGLEDGYSNLSAIYLQVAFSGASSTSGNNRIDNVRLAGDVLAIPEPSTYALLIGVAALGWAAVRRRTLVAA